MPEPIAWSWGAGGERRPMVDFSDALRRAIEGERLRVFYNDGSSVNVGPKRRVRP